MPRLRLLISADTPGTNVLLRKNASETLLKANVLEIIDTYTSRPTVFLTPKTRMVSVLLLSASDRDDGLLSVGSYLICG